MAVFRVKYTKPLHVHVSIYESASTWNHQSLEMTKTTEFLLGLIDNFDLYQKSIFIFLLRNHSNSEDIANKIPMLKLTFKLSGWHQNLCFKHTGWRVMNFDLLYLWNQFSAFNLKNFYNFYKCYLTTRYYLENNLVPKNH